jgi:hypothetical protein
MNISKLIANKTAANILIKPLDDSSGIIKRHNINKARQPMLIAINLAGKAIKLPEDEIISFSLTAF